MKRSRFIVPLCVLLLMPALMFGGDPSKRGTAGALEELIPVGGRGTAIGEAAIASMTGVEAIAWNPAGLSRGWSSSSIEGMFSHMNYFADMTLDYAAVGVNVGDLGVLALSLRSLNFGDIQETTEDLPDGTGRTFSPTFVTVGLSYAKSVTDRIHVGFTTKIISESILRTSALGVALDAGVIYYLGGTTALRGLHFGVALKNIGPNMSFNGEDLSRLVVPPNSDPNALPVYLSFTGQSFELPSSFELGVGYDYALTDNQRFTGAVEFQNMNFGNDQIRIGGEYAYNETFFVRGGYGRTDGTKSLYIFGPTFGAGISTQLGSMDLVLDYAYMVTDVFQGTNTISVKLRI